MSEKGKCQCCPYGYHIDLDFVEFCSSLNYRRFNKSEYQQNEHFNETDCQKKFLLNEKDSVQSDTAKRRKELKRNSDYLELKRLKSATSDMPSSSTDSSAAHLQNNENVPRRSSDSESKSVIDDSVISKKPDFVESKSVVDDNIISKETDFVNKDIPGHDLKDLFKGTNVPIHDSHIESPSSQNGSSSSLSSVSTTSSVDNSMAFSSQVCNGEDHNAQLLEVSSVASNSSGSKSLSSCPGPTTASLATIRDQLATSLPMVRELEKQAKAVPVLQVKLSVMKEEKKLLLLQLKAKSIKNNQRSVGVGDRTVHDNTNADKICKRTAFSPDGLFKAYVRQNDNSATSSHESDASASLAEGLTSPMLALKLNAALAEKGLVFSEDGCSISTEYPSGTGHLRNNFQSIHTSSHVLDNADRIQLMSSKVVSPENLMSSQNGTLPVNSSLDLSSNVNKLSHIKFNTSNKLFPKSNVVKSQTISTVQNNKLKNLTIHTCEVTSYSPCPTLCDSCQGRLSKVFKDASVQVNCDSNDFNYKKSSAFHKDLSQFKCVDKAVNTDPVMVFREDKAASLATRPSKCEDSCCPSVTDKNKYQINSREGYASVTRKAMLKTGVECSTDNIHCEKQKVYKDIEAQTVDNTLTTSENDLKYSFLCKKCNATVKKKTIGVGHYSIFDDVEYRQSVDFKDAQVGSDDSLYLCSVNTSKDINKSRPKDKTVELELCDKCYSSAYQHATKYLPKRGRTACLRSSTPKTIIQKLHGNEETITSGSPIFILNTSSGQYTVSHQDGQASDSCFVKPLPSFRGSSVCTGPSVPFQNSTLSGSSRYVGSASELDTSDSRDSESSDSPEEGSYDGVLGCIVNKCVDDEAIRQGLPGARMFNPLHIPLRQKNSLGKDFLSACKVLNQHLQNPSEANEDMQNILTIIQREWFGLVTQKLTDPYIVEDYLDAFEEISTVLLERIVNLTDIHGNTAMHFALSHNNFDVVALLIDTKVCNVQIKNKAGYTPIMLVCLTDIENATHYQVVRQLLQLGDVNIKASQNGQTALMLAVSRGQLDVVKLLLEAGAEVNLRDDDGSTALMCAAEHGHIAIAKLLLSHPNCDPYITDNDGSNACTIALEAGHKDVGLEIYFNMTDSGNSPYSSLRHNKWTTKTSTSPVKLSPHSPPPSKYF